MGTETQPKRWATHELLRTFRASLGLSQASFARECGVHAVYVAQVETGAARVGIVTAQRIINRWPFELGAAGITFADLINEQRGAGAA